MHVRERRHHHAAERRTNRPRQIVRRRVQRHGIGDQLARHQLRNDRLPRWVVHRRTRIEQKRKRQQRPWRNMPEKRKHGQQCHRGQHPRLPKDQQLAPVEDVGGRAGQQPQQQHRQRSRRLHQRDQQRRRGQNRHQPRSRRILHPRPNRRDGRRDPTVAKQRNPQRRETRSHRRFGGLGRRLGVGGGQGHGTCLKSSPGFRLRSFGRLHAEVDRPQFPDTDVIWQAGWPFLHAHTPGAP